MLLRYIVDCFSGSSMDSIAVHPAVHSSTPPVHSSTPPVHSSPSVLLETGRSHQGPKKIFFSRIRSCNFKIVCFPLLRTSSPFFPQAIFKKSLVGSSKTQAEKKVLPCTALRYIVVSYAVHHGPLMVSNAVHCEPQMDSDAIQCGQLCRPHGQ